MKHYLPDGSSEYCLCGHSAKDHQIRHVESISTSYRYEEGEGSGSHRVTIYKDLKGLMVFCWGQNIGGINCMSEGEKGLAQRVVLIKQDGIFFPSSDPYLHNTVKCQCKQFRPYKRNDGKEPTYRCSICGSITKAGQFSFINDRLTICSHCYYKDECWKHLKAAYKFIR
jgi:hypothetical protein